MVPSQQFLSRDTIDMRQCNELGGSEIVLLPLDSCQPAWRDLEFQVSPLSSKLCALFRDFSGRELRLEAQGAQSCADLVSFVEHDNSPGIHRDFPVFPLYKENQASLRQIRTNAILANPMPNSEVLAGAIGEGIHRNRNVTPTEPCRRSRFRRCNFRAKCQLVENTEGRVQKHDRGFRVCTKNSLKRDYMTVRWLVLCSGKAVLTLKPFCICSD
jgi:hypothetical protein